MSICRTDKHSSVVLKDSLGLEEYIISRLQWNRLRWYDHILRKDDGDWIRCLTYEVEGIQPRGCTER